MAIQNLAIKHNVNLPNTSHKILAKVGSNFYQILINTFINGPNTYKIMPKLKNLAKSGHTAVLRIYARIHQDGFNYAN